MSEEFAEYLPHIRRRWLAEQAGWDQRREHAWTAARQVALWLREQFAVEDVIVFGSLAHQGLYDDRSDIDVAVCGIPPARFYWTVAQMDVVCPDFEVDLIDMAHCSPRLLDVIKREGIAL